MPEIWVTIYWIGAALTALWCAVGAVRLVRETRDPGLAGAGIILVLLWPLLIPLCFLSMGGEWFINWLRKKTDHTWPWPFGKLEAR